MNYDPDMLTLYTEFVRERHRVWSLRLLGEPPPWTEDPVISRLKFTNMFRILDPGTQFVMKELNTPDYSDYMARCVLYRVTNRPKTWRYLRTVMGDYPRAADMDQGLVDVLQEYRDRGEQVFSGAYIILPEPGTKNDKIEGAVRLTARFMTDHWADFLMAETQEERFNILRRTPGIGPFLAMQILTDYGYGLAEDREGQFIVAGPGARRGTAHLAPGERPEQVIYEMCDFWAHDRTVLLNERSLSLMDVQNTFCEFSKYVRELKKPKKKTEYKPANPGPQSIPTIPNWFHPQQQGN